MDLISNCPLQWQLAVAASRDSLTRVVNVMWLMYKAFSLSLFSWAHLQRVWLEKSLSSYSLKCIWTCPGGLVARYGQYGHTTLCTAVIDMINSLFCSPFYWISYVVWCQATDYFAHFSFAWYPVAKRSLSVVMLLFCDTGLVHWHQALSLSPSLTRHLPK